MTRPTDLEWHDYYLFGDPKYRCPCGHHIIEEHVCIDENKSFCIGNNNTCFCRRHWGLSEKQLQVFGKICGALGEIDV